MASVSHWLWAVILSTALLAPPAATAQTSATVNEVVFSITGESYTSHDMALYRQTLNTVFGKTRISEFSETDLQDFILSRLADKEAQGFSFKPEKNYTVSEAARKKMSAYNEDSFNAEVEIVARSLQWIELKKNQLEQRERFNVWLDVLKRKYQLRLKSPGTL